MAEFAKYGFNKSHAAAYCVLAAQTAWLKNYYPLEFLTAQMTIEQNDSNKLLNYIRDAKEHNFSVLPPHINSSSEKFTIQDDKIHFSLSAVKGIGLSSVREIVRAREALKDKKFSSLEEFFETVDSKKINKKTLDSLIKSGALDGFSYNRKEIFENIEKFICYAEKQTEDQQAGQQSLFSHSLKQEDQVKVSKNPPWPYKEQLAYEKEVFGFYLNDHPMKNLAGLEKSLNFHSISDLKQINNKEPMIQILAMFTSYKEISTKKRGQLMAFSLLEDSSASIEAILFPELWAEKKSLIKAEEVFYIKGILQKNRGTSHQIVVEDILLLDDFLKQIHKIVFQLNPDIKKAALLELKELISNCSPGPSSVHLQAYIPKEKIFVDIDTQKPRNIKINHDFLHKTHKIFKTTKNIHLYRT